ncbi:TraR/DksA family transcriptional regulator [Sulfurihydrogenibium azorense]|jgi:RNA polymerase-binding protein DksA|uniref:DnaK suppressor protein n=1 Tax=Sulfurihydrogenibium azorense (strain DSM 15241 / OCM 825 / Az-Fu1) TaxID=204536 RepID=C1DXX0_SULAA|nr:TraR/DksA family transcriptional regulator [Sulfurihydrogenibium azorense]ACN98375.1 DnaK suppressor protein [Sulfurihydrogenibium azorense Az-Fu1]MDM7273497.1 TraR/DksA family transcriptional regulator [Sulfurihydrogenibium azorense]
MEKEKLKKYERLLLKKRNQILERYLKKEETQKVLTEQATEPRDIDEYALIDITEEILGELSDIEIEIIKAIDEALERIKNGTYGICEVCGKEIEEERLEAVPWTTLCIQHAKERELYEETPDLRYKEYFDNLVPREKPTSEEEAGEL